MPAESDRLARAIALIEQRTDTRSGMVGDPALSSDPTLGMQRVTALLATFEEVSRAIPMIHVAGSIGKGSTCAFLTSVLTSAGYRTGTFTSPHLHHWQERIAVDSASISDDEFASLAFEFDDAAAALQTELPQLGDVRAFDMLTAMALVHFAREQCDAVVMEVGLGGRFDPTNVIDPAVTVLTRIDYEHTSLLGHTLGEIAWNKAGIIKPGVPVVSSDQAPEVVEVIRQHVNESGSLLLVAGADFRSTGTPANFEVTGPWGTISELSITMRGQHQLGNASTAVAALLGPLPAPFIVQEESIRQGLASASAQGRLELHTVGDREILLDVAHSPLAARALRSTVLALFAGEPAWVVAMLSGRDPAEFLANLVGPGETVIVTQTGHPRSVPAQVLHESAASASATSALNPETALSLALSMSDAAQPVIVTGSVEFVARMREYLRSQQFPSKCT